MYGDFYESYKKFVEEIQSRKIVLFCAGQRCMDIMNKYYRYPYDEIAFICDNDTKKQGGEIYNVPICSPSRLLENPDDYVVLITVYDHYAIKRIIQQLTEMNVSHYYSALILLFTNMIGRYDINGNRKNHELNTYKIVEENADKIEYVKKMLCDEKSVKLYECLVEKVKYNLGDYKDVADDSYEHYFSDGIFKYTDREVLIDGGAYDGDDTMWLSTMLRQEGKKLKRAYCFEPDNSNFAKTYRNLEMHFGVNTHLRSDEAVAECEQFIVYRSGLFDKNCRMGFREFGAENSRFTEEKSDSGVPVVRLDDVVDDRVTFIKYDLEGADIPAIRGAEKIIRKYRPKLALSLYHNIEDLWEIPLLVKGYVPEYKLFIRHHSVWLWDKIMYAAVEEDLI